VPEAAGAEDRNAQVSGEGVDDLSYGLAHLVTAHAGGLGRVVAVHQHGDDRRLEVGERLRRAHECVAEALFRLGHVHAKCRVEAALHEAGEDGDAQLRVALYACASRAAAGGRRRGNGRRRGVALAGDADRIEGVMGQGLGSGERAFKLLTYVHREGGEVTEVEALHLVVAEDDDDVRLALGQLGLEGVEGLANTLGLRLALLKVVARHVRANGAGRAHNVPVLRRHEAERRVCRFEDAYKLCHVIPSPGAVATAVGSRLSRNEGSVERARRLNQAFVYQPVRFDCAWVRIVAESAGLFPP
jgi:hypothetical protein